MKMEEERISEEVLQLRDMYETLRDHAVLISESILEKVQSIDRIRKIYSYLAFTVGVLSLFVLLYIIGWVLSTRQPEGPIVLYVLEAMLIGLTIVAWKYSNVFDDLLISAGDLWSFHYKIKFEAFAPKGKDPIEKIVNQVKNVFPEVDDYIKEKPSCLKINAEISGKTEKHQFDVYIRVDRNILNKLTFGRLGESGYNLIIRRFDKEEPVTEEDLMKLRSEIEDIYPQKFPHNVLKKPPDNVLVIATSSFTDTAVKYAMKGENWIPSIKVKKKKGEKLSVDDYLEEASLMEIEDFCTLDLIEEHPEGYRVIWAL